MAADDSENILTNLGGVAQGKYSFMNMDTIPELQEDALPTSPAPADEEHPLGSSDEDESDNEEEEAGSEGETLRRDVDEMAVLNIDDELADDEVSLRLQICDGYYLVSLAPAALTAALVMQSIMLRLGVGWLKGIITQKTKACTRHLHAFKSFLDIGASTCSLRLPLAK